MVVQGEGVETTGLGERLLRLQAEWSDATTARSMFGAESTYRDPAVIAAEYEQALRDLLA